MTLPLYRLALIAFALAPAVAAAQGWTSQPSGTTADLSDVHFLSDAVGFAVADGGLLLSTTDGGATWTQRTLNAGLDNQGIAFNPSGTVGVIITDDGPVFRTTDGGATWTSVATGMGDGRATVAWGTDAVVWVAGRDGDGAVSTDGGATWTYRPTGAAQRTEGMAAVGTQTAWIVGRVGEIRVTTNGGATWTAQPSGTSADLKDIQMLDANTGYIAGSDDTVLKTTNGGATWTDVATSGVGGDGLFFLDANTGWVVGDVGEIWFTSDGGASWTAQPSGTGFDLSRVHFPTSARGFAVGDGGAVVRFAGVSTAGEAGPGADGLALTLGANPVRERARLVLALPEAGATVVAVYDALGRRVAVVHDGPLAAGIHPFELDAAALPAGAYVVRAEGEGTAVSRRLVVAR